MLAEPERTPASLVFLGTQGDEVSFEIEPLTDLEAINARPLGYIENQSRTDWSTRAREARDGTLDLGAYNLHLTAALFRPDGSPVTRDGAPVRIAATPDDAGSTQTVELPRTGWYKLEVVRDDEANDENAGYAWVKVRGVELLPSQSELLAAREVEYGPRPTAARALLAEEAAYRYEGTRTFAEFISLQVAPFLSTIALEAVVGTALFLNGWVIGILGRRERRVRRTTLAAWVLSVPVILLLLGGIEGSRALPAVPSIQWGGLLLTMLLTVVGIAASFPLGVALALGRRSDLPVIKLVCTLFIETIRGVPLITILFMAKLIVPFFWVGLSDLDMTVRMMIGVTLFSAAYLAENVRGGLQIIPHGQIEAARALGMNPLLMTTLIVLPQALRAVIPAIVGQFISLFKDTSLVAVVGLFELVGIVDIIVSGQPIYRPYQREAYIFIALIYFVISYAMSDVSRRLEASGAGSVHARR
ncbi:MAG: amino acid ABC transporter permease [Chloroflexi bacterium]|nr:amino acid ABC transporter permease [Chloroflexota bacterium]